MIADQFDRVEQLFDATLDLPPDQREAYLADACGDDEALQQRVERLLRHVGRATANVVVWSDVQETIDVPEYDPDHVEKPGTKIGPYALRELIGEGGFGSVYLAEQEHPVRREVALKIIKMGMDTKRVIARFEAERQALALMNHPNVARVFDAGATDTGRPYFVMEYVPGEPITEYCDRHHLSTRGRLELFMQACGAVQHAHQKGIIHRDVKPSNVLVSAQGEGATVKVIDFGVAKATGQRLTERTLFTETGELVGTPEYMSPEQAEGGADIDTRTDVYALGIVLYELLTGSLPFDPEAFRKAGYDEIRRVIREEEPPTPSTRLSSLGERSMEVARRHESDPRTLLRELRGDLDWIAMRALEKDRTRRYATPASLAADVQRYLDHEPVVASPPSRTYRVRKFVRRHRVGVTAGSVVAVAILVGAAMSAAGFRQAVRERADAVMARDESEAVTSFLSDMFREISPWEQGQDLTVRQVMDEAAGSLDEQFADRPAIRGRLHHVIGETYFYVGMNDEAERHLKAAIEDYRASFGEDHLNIAEASSTLGLTYYLRGRFEEAERWLEATIELREKLLGSDNDRTIIAKGELALIYKDQQRHAEAEALIRPALEAANRLLGPEDPTRLTTMHNLALILKSHGKLDESRPLIAEVVTIRRRILPADHPDTLVSINLLAGLYQFEGNLEEATELFEESLAGLRRHLGEDHQNTVSSKNNLALVYLLQERYADAEPLYADVVDAVRANMPPGFFGLGIALSGHAYCLKYFGRFDEAEAAFLEAYPILETAMGPDHKFTVRAARGLCELYGDTDRPQEAAPWCARVPTPEPDSGTQPDQGG